MELEFKHLVLIYSILIALIFLFKPQLFKLNNNDNMDMKRHKFVVLAALFIVLAIIAYYIKLYLEYYM
jgi:hypothetical protein